MRKSRPHTKRKLLLLAFRGWPYFVLVVIVIAMYYSTHARIQRLFADFSSSSSRQDQELHDVPAPTEQVSSTPPLFKGIDIDGAMLPNGSIIEESLESCRRACALYWHINLDSNHTAHAHSKCNGWSYCGNPKKCSSNFKSCILKNIPDVTRMSLSKAGPEVGWTSGVVVPETKDVEQLLKARGFDVFSSDTMVIGLHNSTSTIHVISPKVDPTFNFALPGDSLVQTLNDAEGFHHIGDVTFRVKVGNKLTFDTYSTVSKTDRDHVKSRKPPKPVRKLPNSGQHTHNVDLSPQLPPECPLRVQRWIDIPYGADNSRASSVIPNLLPLPGEVHVWFNVSSLQLVERLQLGSFGVSLPMDQYFPNRRLEQVAVQCSFVEGYPGGHFGYVQVTRASGQGPVLLILPMPGTAFEAWRPLKGEDRSELGFAFEGHFEIMFHSQAWASNEWMNTEQWVTPTSKHLDPGQYLLYGFRILLAPSPKQVEATLLAAGLPVVTAVPGFILHTDMTESRLFVQYPSHILSNPSVTTQPSSSLALQLISHDHSMRGPSGSFFAASHRSSSLSTYRISSPAAGCSDVEDVSRWSSCNMSQEVAASGSSECPCYVGRVRLLLSFKSKIQLPHSPINYTSEMMDDPILTHVSNWLLLPPARTLVQSYGTLSSDPEHGCWLSAESADPWGRGPAFMGYDNQLRKMVTAEQRVFMSGLSDEAGAAQPLAMAVKQLGLPVPSEIAKLEDYVHDTLLQRELDSMPSGRSNMSRTSLLKGLSFIQDNVNFSVRASMFFFKMKPEFLKAQPEFIKACNASHWWLTCWDEGRSMETWRAYNYPHVAAVYWSLYKLARRDQLSSSHASRLVKRATWQWYLQNAVKTSLAMWQHGKGYGKWGLMVGSVFCHILEAVEEEGWVKEAKALKDVTKERLEFWQSLTFPFGSEMPWDNTGHEEIYSWLTKYRDEAGADATVQAVLAYDGLFPHWGISGSARRWWDFFINGKTDIGNERVLHHYAGALNAVPLHQQYLRHPDDVYLARLATAGIMGSVSNIQPHGGTSMGFHGDLSLLRPDGYSADWGIGFFGYATQITSILLCSRQLGWLCFHCDIIMGLNQPSSKQLYDARTSVDEDNDIATEGGLSSDKHNNSRRRALTTCTVQNSNIYNIKLKPRDAFRSRFFFAPTSLLLTVEAGGYLDNIQVDMMKGVVIAHIVLHHPLNTLPTAMNSAYSALTGVVFQVSLRRTTKKAAAHVSIRHRNSSWNLLPESNVLASVDEVHTHKACLYSVRGCLFTIKGNATKNIFQFAWMDIKANSNANYDKSSS